MTSSAGERMGISRQRGFWLRCFLGVFLVSVNLCGPASAQVEGPATLHFWRLHGVVVDAGGKPVAGEAVNLVRDDKVEYSTTTDGSGRFDCKGVSGHYWLRMKPKDASVVNREVVVGDEALMLLKKNVFYVILGPRQCTDDCSQVFTSKGDFEKAIKRVSAHQYR